MRGRERKRGLMSGGSLCVKEWKRRVRERVGVCVPPCICVVIWYVSHHTPGRVSGFPYQNAVCVCVLLIPYHRAFHGHFISFHFTQSWNAREFKKGKMRIQGQKGRFNHTHTQSQHKNYTESGTLRPPYYKLKIYQPSISLFSNNSFNSFHFKLSSLLPILYMYPCPNRVNAKAEKTQHITTLGHLKIFI